MKTVAILRSSPAYSDSRVTKYVNELQKLGYEVIVYAWDRENKVKDFDLSKFGEHVTFRFYN